MTDRRGDTPITKPGLRGRCNDWHPASGISDGPISNIALPGRKDARGPPSPGRRRRSVRTTTRRGGEALEPTEPSGHAGSRGAAAGRSLFHHPPMGTGRGADPDRFENSDPEFNTPFPPIAARDRRLRFRPPLLAVSGRLPGDPARPPFDSDGIDDLMGESARFGERALPEDAPRWRSGPDPTTFRRGKPFRTKIEALFPVESRTSQRSKGD